MTDEFKKMTFKKKAEHIWEYYRVNIFLTVFILFVAGSLLNTVFFNPAPKSYATIAFYDDNVNTEVMTAIEDIFTEKFVNPSDNLKVKCMAFYGLKSDPIVAVDMDQKFQMLFYGKEIDIVSTSSELFERLSSQGAFLSLDKFLSAEEIAQFEKDGMILYAKGYDGGEVPFGVSLKNTTTVLKEYGGFEQEKRYVGISAATERIDNARNVFLELVE